MPCTSLPDRWAIIPFSQFVLPLVIPAVVAGDVLQTEAYPWAIVSDPIRAFLFVLVRDPETFFGSQHETDVLAKCEELGFTAFWNSPRATEHEGCEYTAPPVPPLVEDKAVKLSPALLLRGGGLGVGGPLHASCKVREKRGCVR